MTKPWRDETTLRKLHHDEGLCMAEIARRLDCGAQTVSRWLRKLDIEVRQNSHAPAGDGHHNSKPQQDRREYDGSWGRLRYEYQRNHDMVCERCGDGSMPDHRYHLHHTDEDSGRGSTAAKVDVSELVPLCNPCHTAVEVNGYSIS